MPGINFLAVVVAAALAFVASAVWYIVFGKQLTTVSAAFAQGLQKRQPWKLLGVMAQSLVLAYLLGLVGKVDWLGALGVGVLLWIGLAAMQWVGSLMWENVPVKMAAIHAGDWLLKLVLTVVIVGAWH